MSYRVQNSETGETDYLEEINNINSNIKYDEETGEPTETTCYKIFKFRYRKTKFHIPKEYLRRKKYRKSLKPVFLSYCRNTYSFTNKRKVIKLKEEIILGYNKTSHRMFLIPSLFFFTNLTALIFIISEIFLHVWAHKKNSKNSNPNIYYRSPLHILTSQFCGKCRSQTEYENINKMHRLRSRKLHTNLQKIKMTLA